MVSLSWAIFCFLWSTIYGLGRRRFFRVDGPLGRVSLCDCVVVIPVNYNEVAVVVVVYNDNLVGRVFPRCLGSSPSFSVNCMAFGFCGWFRAVFVGTGPCSLLYLLSLFTIVMELGLYFLSVIWRVTLIQFFRRNNCFSELCIRSCYQFLQRNYWWVRWAFSILKLLTCKCNPHYSTLM